MGIFSAEIIWFLIGIAFLACELAVPAFVIIFFGLGAWITAALLLFTAVSINIQVVVFLASSLLSLFILRKYLQNVFTGDKKGGGLDSALAVSGEQAVVTEAIIPPAAGKIKYSGTNWQASADERIEEGEMVVIISQDGLQMKVEKISL
ncbi:MAG: hypothetical protein CSB24_07050 [Deltaproteobacteria bacterium]|nr:MAG: hypothetical protein CSB24_07050 [Deltaproteobacteria bacterium]